MIHVRTHQANKEKANIMKELKKAIAAVDTWTAKHKLIDEKLKQSEDHRHELIGVEADTKSRLAQSEAENSLEPNPKAQAAARKALLEVRDEIEVTEACIEGLKNLAIQHDDEFEAVHTEFNGRVLAPFKEEQGNWTKDFREVVKSLAAVMMRGQAIEVSFCSNIHCISSAKKALMHDLKDPDTGNTIIHIEDRYKEGASWRSDPASKQIRGLCKLGDAEVIEDLLVIKYSPSEATEIILRLRVGLPNNAPIPIFSAGLA